MAGKSLKSMGALDWSVMVLIIAGGLNWGVLGLFNVNLVELLLGGLASWLPRLVYTLVGASTGYWIWRMRKMM